MTGALDYDTLEILGAALRDRQTYDLDERMSSELRELCERLEMIEPDAHRPRHEQGSAGRN